MSSLIPLTRTTAYLAICMGLTPAIFSLGPDLEKRFFWSILHQQQQIHRRSDRRGTSTPGRGWWRRRMRA